jgi:aminoglycoside 6'-N-acetyltransferase I
MWTEAVYGMCATLIISLSSAFYESHSCYVVEGARHSGIGRQLLSTAEDWARSHGCIEMASDTRIDNELSQTCHKALGFEVVDRCVHYRKTL